MKAVRDETEEFALFTGKPVNMTNSQENTLKPLPSAAVSDSAQRSPESLENRIIDYAVLGQLKADISESLFPELLALFLEQGTGRVEKIEQAIAENNFLTLESEIHSFKSESATFGATRLAELTTQINALCHQGKKEQAFAAAKAVKEQWPLVYQALQK